MATGSGEIARNITLVAEAAENTSQGTQSAIEAAGDIEEMATELLLLIGDVRQAAQKRFEEPKGQASEWSTGPMRKLTQGFSIATKLRLFVV